MIQIGGGHVENVDTWSLPHRKWNFFCLKNTDSPLFLNTSVVQKCTHGSSVLKHYAIQNSTLTVSSTL